ncbi:MAG TPA: FAD-dependent oxidoreductase [Drouetiella sp.]|jgi:glycine/D-amino acid oxidase-like deaminating enzyme
MTMKVPMNAAPWRDTCPEVVLSHLQLPAIDKMPDELTYDVVIIGGGFAGLSTAGAAARAGASVVVLEDAKELACGASGRNAGILCAGINMPITYTPKGSPAAALWSATQEMLYSVLSEAKETGCFLDVMRIGAMALATSKTASKRLERETKARLAAGMSAELISQQDVDRLAAGYLDVSRIHQAMLLPDEGAIHPWTLLATLANKARKAGAQIYGNARVVSKEKNSKGWTITTENGKRIQCRGVISAVGPTVNTTGRIFALSFKTDVPDTCPVWWDANPYIYYDFRPGNGCLTVSGGRYGAPGTDKLDKSYHEKMAAATRQWVPSLANVEPDYCWAVDLHVAADLLPEIAEFGENALSIQGLGALGVLPGIVLGQQAGDRITRVILLKNSMVNT